MRVEEYLAFMVEAEASDLHLKVGLPAVIRVNGVLHRTHFQPLSDEDTERLALELIPQNRVPQFEAG